MKPLKILQVNTCFSKGGAAEIARTLHNVLNETPGLTSYFAFGRGPGTENKRSFRFAWPPEIYLHAFLTRTTGLQGYGSYRSTRNLLKLIAREQFDLIHIHNLHGYYLDLSFPRALGKLNIPIVWTVHDGWPVTGRCAYLSECERWKTGCGDCPNLSSYPGTYLDCSSSMWKRKDKYLAQGWNPTIVCPSQWLADRLKESYLSKHRIEVIHNGIDTDTFKPEDKVAIREKLGIDSAKKVILFAAADLKDERKGARYFFEALQYIKHNDWVVLTLGKKINLDMVVKKDMDIRQLGYISDRNTISEIYNAADIFCTSSLDESFGLTTTEAMACGIPVTGFRIGGIPEQVTDGCGIMAPPGDTQALGRAMDILLSDEGMRSEFSINCRKRAVQTYSNKIFANSYIKLYREALEYNGQ